MKNYKRVALLLCIMLLTGTFAGCGWSKKEKDKSALVRSAVDMVLDIPDLEYSSLKNAAAQQGRSMGEIVFKALQAYLGI